MHKKKKGKKGFSLFKIDFEKALWQGSLQENWHYKPSVMSHFWQKIFYDRGSYVIPSFENITDEILKKAICQ